MIIDNLRSHLIINIIKNGTEAVRLGANRRDPQVVPGTLSGYFLNCIVGTEGTVGTRVGCIAPSSRFLQRDLIAEIRTKWVILLKSRNTNYWKNSIRTWLNLIKHIGQSCSFEAHQGDEYRRFVIDRPQCSKAWNWLNSSYSFAKVKKRSHPGRRAPRVILRLDINTSSLHTNLNTCTNNWRPNVSRDTRQIDIKRSTSHLLYGRSELIRVSQVKERTTATEMTLRLIKIIRFLQHPEAIRGALIHCLNMTPPLFGTITNGNHHLRTQKEIRKTIESLRINRTISNSCHHLRSRDPSDWAIQKSNPLYSAGAALPESPRPYPPTEKLCHPK